MKLEINLVGDFTEEISAASSEVQHLTSASRSQLKKSHIRFGTAGIRARDRSISHPRGHHEEGEKVKSANESEDHDLGGVCSRRNLILSAVMLIEPVRMWNRVVDGGSIDISHRPLDVIELGTAGISCRSDQGKGEEKKKDRERKRFQGNLRGGRIIAPNGIPVLKPGNLYTLA